MRTAEDEDEKRRKEEKGVENGKDKAGLPLFSDGVSCRSTWVPTSIISHANPSNVLSKASDTINTPENRLLAYIFDAEEKIEWCLTRHEQRHKSWRYQLQSQRSPRPR